MPAGALGALYRVYFRRLLPRLGGLLSDRSAYSYLPASVERFPSPGEFARLLRQAGFDDVRFTLQSFGIACLHRGEKP
jgi:demethylmenaquinone methyltransferase/2-methoxy-6-polyprenyl-1,4-benzoquinol methylase